MLLGGVATRLMGTVQGDLSLAGMAREQRLALYAAEHAVAQAQALLAQNGDLYDAAGGGGWTPVLTTTRPGVAEQRCTATAGNGAPETTPGTAPQLYYGAPGGPVTFRYCLHNNSEDPAYLDPAGNAAGQDGDGSDARDPQHLLTIEAFGAAPNGAAARVTILVGPPGSMTFGPCNAMGEEQDECAQ